MRFHGITLIKNGETLGYPYKLVINSLKSICDDVWVNVDPSSEDDTLEQVKSLGGVNIIESVWDMSCTGDGSELAKQANLLLDEIPENEPVVYLQADEIIHQARGDYIRKTVEACIDDSSHDPYTAWELYRAYFWKDFITIRTDWSMYLARVFLNGAARVDGDGMGIKRLYGRVYRTKAFLYHYSRIGDAALISKRVSVLDKLFHPHSTVPEDVPEYDFKTREFDCYSTEERPKLKDDNLLAPYKGGHPEGVMEFYGFKG